MKGFTASCSGQIEQLKQALETADAVLIGAGSGLSTSAGLTYMLPKAGIQTLYGGTSMRRCCIWSWVWETIRRLLSSIRSGNIRWKTQTLSMPV